MKQVIAFRDSDPAKLPAKSEFANPDLLDRSMSLAGAEKKTFEATDTYKGDMMMDSMVFLSQQIWLMSARVGEDTIIFSSKIDEAAVGKPLPMPIFIPKGERLQITLFNDSPSYRQIGFYAIGELASCSSSQKL